MVCLRNVSVDTLHKGDTEDDDGDSNNNNNIVIIIMCRNCLLKHIIKVKIERTGRRGRRLKQLLDDLNERRRCWKLKQEATDRTLWRIRFGRGYEPVTRLRVDNDDSHFCNIESNPVITLSVYATPPL
jgi:hypothetical protein